MEYIETVRFWLSPSIDYVEGVCQALGPWALSTPGIVVICIVCLSSLTEASFDNHGKHVVVTGGSSGIGLEAAMEYVRRGANVSILARNQKKLDQPLVALKDSVPEGGSNKLCVMSVDVSAGQKSVDKYFERLVEAQGNIDVLLNCAGTFVAGAFNELEDDDFENIVNVNYLGSVYPTRAALKTMKGQKGGGRLIFVASQVAQVAIYGYTAYAASKWALRGLVEALQMEAKPHGIYVSVAYPPDTDTPGYEAEMQTKPGLTSLLSAARSVFQPIMLPTILSDYQPQDTSISPQALMVGCLRCYTLVWVL
jgi:3-dehydrosphinganine reductase